jgi:hypothetical protein
MSLKVIGAGFGRTGTLSLKLALEQLGFGPCYHMVETLHHPAHDAAWLALARGKAKDWRAVLGGYQATVDWPGVYFWRALAAANPDAKIILTVRNADQWYDSAANTIFSRMRDFTETLAHDDNGTLGQERRAHMRMVNSIVADGTFDGYLDRAHAIDVFNAHNEDVRRSVPPKKLLVYQSGEGWDRLCDFLDAPVPQAHYPKVNSATDFKNQFPESDHVALSE